MKTLIALAIVLLLAAIGEYVKPAPVAAPPVTPIAASPAPAVYQVTSGDVSQMIYCGSYLIMISKHLTTSDQDHLFSEKLAQGWLRTAMFYAAAVESDYVAFLNGAVIDAKMHSENLMGAVGVEGMVTSFYNQCSDLMPITEEYVAFWEEHGNA